MTTAYMAYMGIRDHLYEHCPALQRECDGEGDRRARVAGQPTGPRKCLGGVDPDGEGICGWCLRVWKARQQLSHGNASTYRHHRCRCADCTEAWRVVALRQRRQRTPARMRRTPGVVHGRVSTYNNWNCRCRKCKDANALEMRNRRRTKAAAREEG